MTPDQIAREFNRLTDSTIMADVIARQPDWLRCDWIKPGCELEFKNRGGIHNVDFEFLSDSWECEDLKSAYVRFLVCSFCDSDQLSHDLIADLAAGLQAFADVLADDVEYRKGQNDDERS